MPNPHMWKPERKTEQRWDDYAERQNDRAPTQCKCKKQKYRRGYDIERDCDSKKRRCKDRPKPLTNKIGLGGRPHQSVNCRYQPDNHHTVEVRSARETVNHERIPGVPGRIAVTIFPADQSQKQSRNTKICDSKYDLVENRLISETAQKLEKQLRARRVDRV